MTRNAFILLAAGLAAAAIPPAIAPAALAASVTAGPAGAAAAADVPGNATTRARQAVGPRETAGRTFDFALDTDWYRIDLEKGEDYLVTVLCHNCSFALRNAAGRALGSGGNFDESDSYPRGFEVRAPYTGTYFLEAVDRSGGDGPGFPQPYATLVAGDCPRGRDTHCRILPGATRRGDITTTDDGDGFRAPLQAGHTYEATIAEKDPANCYLAVEAYDPKGNSLDYGSVVSLSPARSGVYLLTVVLDGYSACPYALTLTDTTGARR